MMTMLLPRPSAVLMLLSATPSATAFVSPVLSLQHSTADLCTTRVRHHSCSTLLQASTTTASWKPCAQPRFDEFAEYTVGPWITTSSSQPPSDVDAAPVQEVEEVMRSCGGAIQGIRELPLSIIFPTECETSDRTYHNRADGGFVYADDGSYSAGPEQCDLNKLDESEKLFMASLTFPNRRRMWLTTKLSDASHGMNGDMAEDYIINSKALELFRSVSISEREDDSTLSIESNISKLPNVNWKTIKRVRMPNTSQAWALARAKWEKQTIEYDDESEEDADATTENMGALVGCTFIEASQENSIFGDVVSNDAVNLHMMAMCPASKVARSVIRCYDTNGSLKSVAFLDGSIIHEQA